MHTAGGGGGVLLLAINKTHPISNHESDRMRQETALAVRESGQRLGDELLWGFSY